jgi:hypothetical protein
MVLVDGSLVAERMLAVAEAVRKHRRSGKHSDVLSQREVDFADSTFFFRSHDGNAGSVASATSRCEVSYREQLTF